MATALIGALAAPALAAGNHSHDPVHGGVVSAGKEADFELVAKANVLQLYVSDHGKARDLANASAKVTLLSGKHKQEAMLQPIGDRLEATGSFKVDAGTKVVAVVTDGGKTLGTARFTLK
ncbi:MAG: hypothetical protein EOO31_03530 [Comamonadaceae bacterium]|nr:MAG: hypothetical protein EOO31_03530 [Comamonadaceae bacterium]